MRQYFFFKDTATTEIYTYCHTLSLPDALPICGVEIADRRPCVAAQQVGESAVVVQHGGVALQDESAIVGLDSLVPATGAVVQQADAVPGPPERRIASHGALQRELGDSEERRVGKECGSTCRYRC